MILGGHASFSGPTKSAPGLPERMERSAVVNLRNHRGPDLQTVRIVVNGRQPDCSPAHVVHGESKSATVVGIDRHLPDKLPSRCIFNQLAWLIWIYVGTIAVGDQKVAIWQNCKVERAVQVVEVLNEDRGCH